MQNFVDDNFKIDIFLDTNILVDYVLGTKASLTHSIDYLNNKRSVRLRSSHYVEFELAEVLKICFFGHSVLGHYPNKQEKSQIKSGNWIANGIDYTQKMQEISVKVNQEMSRLKTTFDRLFDDHVLHDGLIDPTCDFVLHSKVSREDSMVAISSVFPTNYDRLEDVSLLSNDSQLCSAIIDNDATITSVLNQKGLKKPLILNAKKLNCSSIKSQFNISNSLYNNQTIEYFWDKKILELVTKKNKDTFIGKTYKFGRPNTISGECVYFNLQDASRLNNTNSLLFFTNDAEETISIKLKTRTGNLEFWNGGHSVTLPNDNVNDLRYSFKPLEGMLEPDELKKLREPGNLVFYLNE